MQVIAISRNVRTRFILCQPSPPMTAIVRAGAPNERVLSATDMALLDMGAE